MARLFGVSDYVWCQPLEATSWSSLLFWISIYPYFYISLASPLSHLHHKKLYGAAPESCGSMDFSDLRSDATLDEWNHAIMDSSGWIDPPSPLKYMQPPQNTFEQTLAFPPPPTTGSFSGFLSKTPPHTFQVGADSQGSFSSHQTSPEAPTTHCQTTVAVASRYYDWEESFLPDHANSQVVTDPPTFFTTPGTAVHEGANCILNSASHGPLSKHQGHPTIQNIQGFFIPSQGPPTKPTSDTKTCLLGARPQVLSLGASSSAPVNPGETRPVHLPIEAPPARSLVSSFPSHWDEIPQDKYDFGRRQQDFEPSNPISFSTKDYPGINLQDALNEKFTGLINPDEQPLAHTGAILCRFQFPGYPVGGSSCQKIQTLNTARIRRAISRDKLAYEIAKKLKKYLDNMTRITPDRHMGDRWRIGHGLMRIENMFLVSFVSVSKGSYQPEIWISNHPAPQVGADQS